MSSDHARLTRFERMLSLVTRVAPGEGRTAFLFFLHGFLLLASYQVVKALREAFMLTKFSAETRAYAVAGMALVLMLVVPLYGRLRHHLHGADLLRAVTLFFVATLPLFALLTHYQVSIAFAFFIWVGIYGVMVVSQMWAYAADSFNVKSGQRLFVVIMLGANLGALAGAKVTQVAVAALSPMGLMVLATCTLGATLFLAKPERDAIPAASRAVEIERSRPVPKLLGGIGLVLRDRYLLHMALFVVLLNWINSTGEFILADFVKADAVARVAESGGALDLGTLITEFYGSFNFWVTLISLLMQLFLVSRIYHLVGVRGGLLVQPVIVALGYALLVFGPMLGGFIPFFYLIRRLKFAENSVDYSLMNTTRQALYLPVDRDSKYDGKIAIDTFFWRFGDLIQAVGIFIGLHLLDWEAREFCSGDTRAGAGMDCARGRDGTRLQPQGERERRACGARGGRAHSGPALCAGRVVHAPGRADGVLRRGTRRRAGAEGPPRRWAPIAALDAVQCPAAGFRRQGAVERRDTGTAHHGRRLQPRRARGAQHVRGKARDALTAQTPSAGTTAISPSSTRSSSLFNSRCTSRISDLVRPI